ncbi:hypothetical protein Hs30E_06330 [Lactococcus hodotermopsidis]|uniref:ABC-2 type transporter transmembrane domain-containing protein n=1 Tax=Pseudolactococcus hodotermopsidis TaxID=2709157 RepID=A0A6A0B9N5_9LACT|nr:ABC transporter permease [Lactococcus hodotermopsidis]GFH42082.1 hypothetical protein Hs30E_06330 [Lactococcus hodotermopsidis]
MQIKYLKILVKKEILTFLKDTKTSIGVILGILLISPLLTWLIYAVNVKTTNDDNLKIVVQNTTYQQLLSDIPNVTIVDKKYQKEDIGNQVNLIIKEDKLFFDSSNLKSMAAANFVNEMSNQININNLKDMGQVPMQLNIVDIANKNSTNVASMYLSYGVVLAIFLAITGISNNTFVLEKEKNIRLSLLATPVSKRIIFLSKLLVVVSFAVIAAVLSFWAMMINSLAMSKILKDYQSLHFSVSQTLNLQLNFVMIAILGSLLTILIISTAKNIKDSSSKVTVINLVLAMSAMLSSVLGITADKSNYSFVPFFNSFLVINSIISNKFSVMFNAKTNLVNLLLLITLIIIYMNLSKKEKYYL